MSTRRNGALALTLAALFLAFAVAPAAADPILGLELTRDPDPTSTPTTHGDERAVYNVTVKNTASAKFNVGDELTCKNSVAQWSSVPDEASFFYVWLRNGEPIPGAEGQGPSFKTYTTTADDQGQGIQCEVTGASSSAKKILARGVATTTNGSNSVTVVTTTATGTLTAGSNEVQNVTSKQGAVGDFLVGQEISGAGIALGTTITAVGPGTLTLSSSATASGSKALSAGALPFAVGQAVSGVATLTKLLCGCDVEVGTKLFPPGTTVTAVNGQTLTLSNNAVGSTTKVDLSATTAIAASAVAVSLPPVVVEPQPAALPPSPSGDPRATESRPQIVGPDGGFAWDGETRTCKAPTNWQVGGAPFAGPWSYQWLRNGIPIPGATFAEYAPVEEEDKYAVLQCEVIGRSGTGVPPDGGATVSISLTNTWIVTNALSPSRGGYRVLENEPSNDLVGNLLEIPAASQLEGARFTVELPGGQETYALQVVRVLGESALGWTCSKEAPSPLQHATVSCNRDDLLAPEAAYPTVKIIERPGQDAPDTLVTRATVMGGGTAEEVSASDEITVGPAVGFGFQAFETKVLDELGNDYTQAGGHPFSAGASLKFKEHVLSGVRSTAVQAGLRAVNGAVRVIRTDTPRGFVGNAQAAPEHCQTVAQVTALPSTCPAGSVVGGITLESSEGTFVDEPIYAMEPEYGTPAQFAFGVSKLSLSFSLTPELRAEDGYAISLLTAPIQKSPELFGAPVTLCSFGAKLGIAKETGESQFQGCKKATDSDANEVPLITNPTRCSGPAPTTRIAADTWEEPGVFQSKEFTAPALTGCGAVGFEPTINLQPTSQEADSPTGMDVEITMPTEGLKSPEGIAQANLDNSTVTLPQGMSVNPSLASGLGACTQAEVGLGNNDEETCPESSKVGSVEVETPLLAEPLKGSVFVARQTENPFKSLLALYLVFESKRDGITIKVAGKVSPDPVTGQLTASFDENPEAPFSKFTLHFASGARAALINPPTCGAYGITAKLSPWSAVDPANPTEGEIRESISTYEVNSGPNGGPCPSGKLDPKLKAGVTSPVAGTTSPFVLDLSREDGTQRFSALDVTMPPGLSGYLKGIPYCSDATLASISSAEGTGAAQLASPSCPAASQLGSVSVGAGAGPNPFYANTGKAYLAGPYKGAPLSLAIVTPALAGPFDLGNVVVRNALLVNPESAQITVKSDPIPTILHGLLLDVRDIRVKIDRPNFILTPTNCEPLSIGAQVTGEKGGSASVSNSFQVGDCARLGFKPRLATRLFGGTKRGQNPRFRAILDYTAGQANIKKVAVTLPHSEFLDNEHIRTICTRVQFAADNCPKGSIYGHAKATSPLVDYTLAGPVYLRSSDHPLPDLVMALKGPASQPIEVDAVGRIDSIHGGIRTRLETIPDVPVSKFTLEMRGGNRGLLVNSRNICAQPARSTVRMGAQNGKTHDFRPLLQNDCRKGKKKHHVQHKRG